MPEPVAALFDWLEHLREETFLGSTLDVWAIATLVAVVVFATLVLVRQLLLTRLRGVVERTKNVLDDVLLDLVERTSWPFFLFLGLSAGLYFLHLPPGPASALKRVFFLIVFMQFGLWADYLFGIWISRHLRRSRQEDPSKVAVLSLFSFFGRVAVWSLVVLLALDNFGLDITTLIAGLGIGGIAIGLALQSVLKDAFASLSIILDKPFEVGDFVIVDELAGNVEQIGIKSTRVRSLSGEELVFSNNDLLSSRVRNYKALEERRVLLQFGLAYDTPNEKLRLVGSLVRDIIEQVESARFDRAYIKSFGASALDFEVAYYVTVPDFEVMMRVRERINLDLHQRFAEEGISFGYPLRRIIDGDLG